MHRAEFQFPTLSIFNFQINLKMFSNILVELSEINKTFPRRRKKNVNEKRSLQRSKRDVSES